MEEKKASGSMFVKETFDRVKERKEIESLIEKGENFYIYGQKMSGKSHLFRETCKILDRKGIPYEPYNTMPTMSNFMALYDGIVKESKDPLKYKIHGKEELKGSLLMSRLKYIINEEYIKNDKPLFYLVIDEFVIDDNRISSTINQIAEVARVIFTSRIPIDNERIDNYRCFYNLKCVEISPFGHTDMVTLLNHLMDDYNLILDKEDSTLMYHWLKRTNGMPGVIRDVVRKIYDAKVGNPVGKFTRAKLKDILEENVDRKVVSGTPIVIAAACIIVFFAYMHASQFQNTITYIIMALYLIALILKQYFPKPGGKTFQGKFR